MRIFDSKPVLRWAAPTAFVLIAAGGGLVALNASAEDTPKPQTAEQLLVDLQQPKVDALSGTIVQTSNLGLPAIPGADGGTSDLTSLLSGTHTVQLWYSGPDKARAAVKEGAFGESDVVTNGTDVWTWRSADNTATHRTIDKAEHPADQVKPSGPAPQADLPKTPQEAAAMVLKALGPSTDVSTSNYVNVAGQKAYELVLKPRDIRSKLTEVRIAIDGDTYLPLRVRAFGSDHSVVFEVAYSRVDFSRPDAETFKFTAPPGAKVTEAPKTEAPKAPSKADRTQAKQQAKEAQSRVKTVGTGWTTVVVAKLPTNAAQSNDQLQRVLTKLPDAKAGSWGSGKLFVGPAFSAVITNDGRVAVGAVNEDLLYQALEK
jgi:outer membrane lipoprotein-sorting protein